jgi:hypothetical protein
MIPPRLHTVLSAPPAEFSPAAIWWWSGEPLTRARLRWQLERFVSGGVHNLIILNLAPSGPMFGADADDPPFFSEAWWELLDGVCADAGELGVYLWFYDQLGFSGAALQARLVQDAPDRAGYWLAPDGSAARRGFDYLSAEACATLLDRVHGEFERRLGHRFGKVIVGSFQDELPSMPTWSARFPAEFAARRGYELTPALLWSAAGQSGREVRRDYHLTRAELAEEAFFRPLATWHERHGLLHGCDQQDPARAGHPVDGVRLYADYMRTHRWFGAPGSDHHGDARIHSSLAHLYGRPRTWIEAFHSTGWGGTLEETFDWLLPWLRTGATLYNPHAVYYTTKGGWWEWAPPSTDWRQPYWRHHKVFADAVTRLCAALSLGRHVCDVAVLFPTATAQAGSYLDGVSAEAATAQRVYREIVGDMTWFAMAPGVLDRFGIDADVIDDDSIQRASVSGGRLRVADEAYQVIVLPACTILEAATARRLAEFTAAGGRVIAVGALPEHEPVLEPVPEFVASPEQLEPLLSPMARVEAPVPALVREIDGATLVFLTATASMASRVSVTHPGERGIELGWLDPSIDFDPGRYLRDMRVRVNGVTGPPLLISPFGGPPRRLQPIGDAPSGGVEVIVPFDYGPAALLLFPADPLSVPPPAAERHPEPTEVDLGTVWEMELVPTLDNTWGDFARPIGESPTLERWGMQHRSATTDWVPAHATFGPHGIWAGPDDHWRPMTYSSSRGIHKDPIHRENLGPKGHVPEEFLDFGEFPAGQRVRFRTALTVPEPGGFLAIGAPAAKTVQIDGTPTPLEDRGYLSISLDPIGPGTHLVELDLSPAEDLWLRAHLAVVRDPEAYRRPEWITVPGPSRPGAEIIFTASVPQGPCQTLQVASTSPCRVTINDREIGRQGGFEPYAEFAIPLVGRYPLTDVLRPGLNKVTVRLVAGAEHPAVLVDGLAVTEPGWRATLEGETTTTMSRRSQHGDPAALHLHRRPHPLPATDWLENRKAPDTVLPTILADPTTGDRTEWLRFTVPPGTTSMDLAVHGEVTVYVEGREHATGSGDPVRLTVDLTGGNPGPRSAALAALRIQTQPGHQAGAALAGPIRFTIGTGLIELGDWETVGLAEYSGGVRYRRWLELDALPSHAELDLGQVRGTAEVLVNDHPMGTRICAPYAVDITKALHPGPNKIEILVLNTLAPYLDAASPTHFVFPGQRISGLLGPIRLRSRPASPLAGREGATAFPH